MWLKREVTKKKRKIRMCESEKEKKTMKTI